MKIILTGINTKYVHTNLAIRYLEQTLTKQQWSNDNLTIQRCEININDVFSNMALMLAKEDGDIYAFSTYLWNLELTLKLAEYLKKENHDRCIVLGGPEVSGQGERYLKSCWFIDAVFSGEGERSFSTFLNQVVLKGEKEVIPGVVYRHGECYIGEYNATGESNFKKLGNPYTLEDLQTNRNKIIYYESSRGCPYRCSYCISSNSTDLSFLPIEQVYSDIDLFVSQKVRQVKFVDRTFNINHRRAYDILTYIKNLDTETNFHFEIVADILKEEMIKLLQSMPTGRVQLEIGVQSTSGRTLKAVDRVTDIEKLKQNVVMLKKNKGLHLHLDLIAGLPYEDYETFRKSFNEIMAIRPEELQLGFLKLLPGCKITRNAEDFGYQYTSFPPYEIIKNCFITTKELHRLKRITFVLDHYYNSGYFKTSFDYLFDKETDCFAFFEEFSEYCYSNNYLDVKLSKDKLYEILAEYTCDELVQEIIKYDYLTEGGKRQLACFGTTVDRDEIRKQVFEYLKNEAWVCDNLPEEVNNTPKKMIKSVRFDKFSKNFYSILGKLEGQDYIWNTGIIIFYKDRMMFE
jgi:radical SAM superfamily enzyme YgiQ (UPF0313 family)